jgi:hypothetical protein
MLRFALTPRSIFRAQVNDDNARTAICPSILGLSDRRIARPANASTGQLLVGHWECPTCLLCILKEWETTSRLPLREEKIMPDQNNSTVTIICCIPCFLHISQKNKELSQKTAFRAHDFPSCRRSCHRIFMSREGRIASENPSLRVNGSEYAKTQGAPTDASGED